MYATLELRPVDGVENRVEELGIDEAGQLQVPSLHQLPARGGQNIRRRSHGAALRNDQQPVHELAAFRRRWSSVSKRGSRRNHPA